MTTTEEHTVPYAPMIRDMPEDERPRERLMRVGARVMSNAELIAIMMRTGVGGENVLRLAERLLSPVLGKSLVVYARKPGPGERGPSA